MTSSNPPIFPTIRFSSFDRIAQAAQRRRAYDFDAEEIDGVWQIPAHVAADALQVSK